MNENQNFKTYSQPDRVEAPGQWGNKGAFWKPFILTLSKHHQLVGGILNASKVWIFEPKQTRHTEFFFYSSSLLLASTS